MHRSFAAALLGTALAFAAPPPAFADAAFLDRFEGRYRGTGSIQREEDASPRRVSCSVSGTRPAANRLQIAGTCRAAVIFTRQIGADIRFDPASGRFSGTYSGSVHGAARLSDGRLRGDTLRLTVTYPVVVHGDRTATMTIRNAGDGRFTLTVTDAIDGTTRETSAISLARG